MPNAIPPYIGITGFTEHAQVRRMQAAFVAAGGPGLGFRLGVGVMTGRRLRTGEWTSFRAVWPNPTAIPKIFAPLPGERSDDPARPFRVLHYVDYDNDGVARRDLVRHLTGAIRDASPGIDALQLDMVWPDPEVLAEVRKAHPEVPLILHVSRLAMERLRVREDMAECGDDLARLLHALDQYQPIPSNLAAVLLDRGECRNRPLDDYALADEARFLREHVPELGIVVGGALGPDTIEILNPFFRRHPGLQVASERPLHFSIDSQRDLHIKRDLLFPIDWDRAAAYLRRAVGHFHLYRR